MRLLTSVLIWLLAFSSIGLAQHGMRIDSRDNFEFQFDDSGDLHSIGLSGTIQQLNPPGNGYRRYRVTFQYGRINPNGVASDTDIEFELTFDGYDGISPTCSLRFTIPKNTTIASAEVLVPVSSISYSLVYKTQVDGKLNPFLSGEENLSIHDSSNSSFIFIGDANVHHKIKSHPNIDFIGVNASSAAWSTRFQQKNQNVSLPNNFYTNSYNTRFALVDQLPTNYLDWTTANKIITSTDSLSRLNDEQAQCLMAYLRSCGSILIYGEKDCDAIRHQVSEWLAKYSKVNSDYWQKSWATNNQESTLDLGVGTINIIGERSLDELLTFDDFNIFTTPNKSYSQADRLSRLRGQPFWNWYLTRLGQPPVGAFAVLIICFAGVFAPALLIYCLRYNRTSWLLVIFPVIAIAGTVLMIVYASLHDGFGTYTRVRSMTLLDPGSDTGVCLSRQVIFSGLTPREGLSFEESSEVWQIDAYEQGYGKKTSAGRLQWTEHKQIFEKMITPREQFQFFVGQPIDNIKPFEWLQYPTASTAPGSKPVCEIKNLLEETLLLVVVSDGVGNFFVTKGLSAGASCKMEQVDAATAANLLKAQEDSQPLELPAGLRSGPSANIVSSALGVRSRYYGGNYSTQSYDLMDDTVTTLIDRNHLASDMCFFVYPESGAYVDRALEKSSERDSLHMIYGKWNKPQ